MTTTAEEPPKCPDCGTPFQLKHTLDKGIIWVRDCDCHIPPDDRIGDVSYG